MEVIKIKTEISELKDRKMRAMSNSRVGGKLALHAADLDQSPRFP